MDKERDTKKIKTLKTIENVLVLIAALVGVATVIDYLIPDPIPFIEEAVLTSVTSLLSVASLLVKKKKKELINGGEMEIDLEEIKELTDSIVDVAKKTSTSIKVNDL